MTAGFLIESLPQLPTDCFDDVDDRVWQLPGPKGLIRDALREFDRRRHVAIILPRIMVHGSTAADGLVQELVRELSLSVDAQQLPYDPDVSLFEALSRALVWDEYPPATVTELLSHEATFGRAVVILAEELPHHQRADLPDLLRRLESESRSMSANDRFTLFAIGHREQLAQFAGGEASDVNLAAVWWWNRIARWDVAAHISHTFQSSTESRLLADVRAEIIVEVARWDLDLAESLTSSWDGDPASLAGRLASADPGPCDPPEGLSSCGSSPSTTVFDLWESGHIDGWHDAHSLSAKGIAGAPARLARLVWAAQARILLPWIEERRVALHDRAVAALGVESFKFAVEQFCAKQFNASGVVEIGHLREIINARIGKTDPWLRSAAQHLHRARNALSHLTPLTYAELTELSATCEGLR